MRTIIIALAVSVGIAIVAYLVLAGMTADSADVFSGNAVRLG